MTSDAKVGLLLGLVFIVIIAFLINGLPGLLSEGSTSMAVDTSVPPYGGNLGLTEKAGDAVNIVSKYDPLKIQKRNSTIKKDARFKNRKHVAIRTNNNSSDKNTYTSKKKYYSVISGDSLGSIAIKFYGPELGNKQATVDMIFQANANILTSPDDIAIDQRLTMPSLGDDNIQQDYNRSIAAGKPARPDQQRTIQTSAFDRLGKAFRNVLSKDKSKTFSLSVYVVKEGDSLWDIADKRLGNGARCTEIQEINNGLLNGSVDVAPGMRLKIPQK